MTISVKPNDGAGLDRRDFLWRAGGGFGAVALAHLMGSESLLADSVDRKTARAAPRAQRRAASRRQGQARRAAVHVGRGQPVRHV